MRREGGWGAYQELEGGWGTYEVLPMSFWNNDDSAARRRDEERQRKAAEAKKHAAVVKARRKAEVIRQKERRRVRAEQDAEDKKLRDELVEKMLNGGKDKKSGASMPSLNRGFNGDRATPTNYQQCFQHLKKSGETGAGAKTQAAATEDTTAKGSGASERSFPPLKRPY